MDRKTYLFHQTPEELCKKLMKFVPAVEGDILLEPFRGEGSFYNNFPENTKNEWCELEEGRCYTSYEGNPDWVISKSEWRISNPPFRLEHKDGKQVNSFFFLRLFPFDLRNKTPLDQIA